jgi:hypothetical protein
MKDDAWKVLFPFNDCHTLRLRVGADLGLYNEKIDSNAGIPLGNAGNRIEISVSEPLTRTAQGEDYDRFLDLTGPGVHEGLTTRSNLIDLDAVLMSIDGAQFSPYDYADAGYRLVNRDGSRASSAFQKVGDSGKAVLLGTELTIRVTGPETNFSMIFSEDTTVVFDNNCVDGSESAFGDIDMLYDVICDSTAISTRFMLEKEASVILSASSAVGVSTANGRTATTTVAPIQHNPSPNGRGLPCNMFQISKPDGLPS